MSDYDDPELAAAARNAARSRRADKRTKLLLTVLSLLLALAVIVATWLAVTNAELATENATFASQQQVEKKEIAKEAGKALCGSGDREIYDRELCEKWAEAAQEPVVTPSPPIGSGPSQAELVQAFREYCEGGNCRGRDGQPPTPDDIAAAFVAFCADGRCTGPAGAPAANGKDGSDGEALPPSMDMVLAAVTQVCTAGLCAGPPGQDGSPGPGPSQEAVLAAVQQFCAGDICRGPKGDTGETGAPGEKGEAPSVITITDATGRTQSCTPNPPGSTEYTCTYNDGLGLTP